MDALIQKDDELDVKREHAGQFEDDGLGEEGPANSPLMQQRSAPTNPDAPVCQVDDCVSELGVHKEYYRRHRVCEMHAKASSATLNNQRQRFCQQCSRFHLLEEFDEGKRSCRRRLLGHNKRRRKQGAAHTGEGSSPPLSTALGQIVGYDTGTSDGIGMGGAARPTSPPDPFATVKRQRAPEVVGWNPRDMGSQGTLTSPLPHGGTVPPLPAFRERPNISPAELALLLPQRAPYPIGGGQLPAPSESSTLLRQAAQLQAAAQAAAQGGSAKAQPQGGLLGFLAGANPGGPPPQSLHEGSTAAAGTGGTSAGLSLSLGTPRRHSPPHTTLSLMHRGAILDQDGASLPEGLPAELTPQQCPNPASAGATSVAASTYSSQDHTGRVSFKLFNRNPEDLPADLRKQVMEWLAHRPSAMESFIRPGCVLLSVHMCMPLVAWQKLGWHLQSCMEQLVGAPGHAFWRHGAIQAQLNHQLAHIHNGKVAATQQMGAAAPLLWQVRPLAVVAGQSTTLTLLGRFQQLPCARIVCSYQEKTCTQLCSVAFPDRSCSSKPEQEMFKYGHLMGSFLSPAPPAWGSHLDLKQETRDKPSGCCLTELGSAPGELLAPSTCASTCWPSNVWQKHERLGKGSEDHDRTDVAHVQFQGGTAGEYGRAFLEVEHGSSAWSSNAWPLLVADAAVCHELHSLERHLDDCLSFSDAALFPIVQTLHNLGWALEELQQRRKGEPGRSKQPVPKVDIPPLLSYAVSRKWSTVTELLLDLLTLRNQQQGTGREDLTTACGMPSDGDLPSRPPLSSRSSSLSKSDISAVEGSDSHLSRAVEGSRTVVGVMPQLAFVDTNKADAKKHSMHQDDFCQPGQSRPYCNMLPSARHQGPTTWLGGLSRSMNPPSGSMQASSSANTLCLQTCR